MKIEDQDIVLDTAIRNWVVIPILFVLFIVSALKLNFSRILQIKSNKKQDVQKLMEIQTLTRAKKLSQYYNRIPLQSFLMRKYYFTNKETGVLQVIEKADDNSPMNMMFSNSMLSDSSGVTDMLKGNVVHMLPQIAMMTWVNHFFSGFVACKLPFFPLTIRFKSFLQRGIEMASLDVTYVSSLSWYFLCWFGSEGINAIVLGENQLTPDQQLFQSIVESGPGQQQVPIHKLYISEKENIELIRHESIFDNVEERFLNNLTKNNLDLEFNKAATTTSTTPSTSSTDSTSPQSLNLNKLAKRRNR
ncbi:transmembrane protein [Tieghemostelium lacteum]|uniref:ER membrane protein complex subunit 3 n=1 Tax=Tieghemostelium lacteum TaxID=361077 RepID=A0A152A3G5_TIELA|nr:transmembrane protein [Tieghemostelium lacteum]|eukprot:KYR00591.1 transmembrane protein [Tieghemostelium lacteum]